MPSDPSVTIRRARQDDIDALAALWEAFLQEQTSLDDRIGPADDALARWRNDVPVWLDDAAYHLVVAASADGLLGFVAAHRWTPPPIYRADAEVYLTELYVAPDARERGIGTALVQSVQAWAHALDADRIRLQVLTANDDGKAFWDARAATPLSETRTLPPAPHPSAPDDAPHSTTDAARPTKEQETSSPLGFQWNKPSRPS